MRTYFPSCKLTAVLPEVSAKASEFAGGRYGLTVVGCCRRDRMSLRTGDTAVYVCNTCAAICEESSPADIVSLWELIAADDTLTLPDYSGMTVTLQRCWRCHDRSAQQRAMRDLLTRMNIEFTELDDEGFCGTTLFAPLPAENAALAPERFVRRAEGYFTPLDERARAERMRAHCARIKTEMVVCGCVSCREGLLLGGKKAVHLAELIFGQGGGNT